MKITKRSFYAKGQTTATPLDIANKVCVHDATLPKWRTLRPDFIPDGQPCYMPVDLQALRRIVDPLKDEAFIQKTIRLNDTVVMFWSMAEDFAKWNVPRSVTESAEDYHARKEAIWQTICDDFNRLARICTVFSRVLFVGPGDSHAWAVNSDFDVRASRLTSILHKWGHLHINPKQLLRVLPKASLFLYLGKYYEARSPRTALIARPKLQVFDPFPSTLPSLKAP